MLTDTNVWNGSLFRQAKNEKPDCGGVGVVAAAAAAGAIMLSVTAAAAESMTGGVGGCWSESAGDGRVQLSLSAANLA